MLVGRVLATAASSSYTIREVNTTGQVVNSSEITIASTTGYHEISNAYTTSGAAIMLIISFIGADVLELWIDGPAGVSTISQPVQQYLVYYSQYDAIISYLDLAYAVKFSHKVNSLSTLTFSLPFDDEKTAELVAENYVKYNTQKYVIKKLSKSRKENALLVECEHIGGGLIDYWHDGLTELTGVSATTALTQALTGTDYTVETVEVSGSKDITLENMTALAAVKKVQEEWSAELVFNNKEVSLLIQQGQNNGIQFRRGKNLQSVLKEENTNNLITKLYGYGKDNLTIVGMDTTSWTTEEKTGLTIDPATHLITQPYIESQYINSYAKEYQGGLTDSSIEAEEDLLAAMQTTLAAQEVPKVRYEVSVVDLSSLAAYYGEGFEIGDTCKVIDEDYNIDISARILELEEWPFEPWKDNVVLGNFQENIHDLVAGLQDTQKTIEKVLSGGKVNTYWLTGVINALQNQIKASGAYESAEVLEDQGFLLENTNPISPDYGALYLGPGIFAIADDKAGDEWNWRTFGTGKGFTADEFNAGTLNTSLVKIMGTDVNFYWDETGLWCIDGDNVVRISSAGIEIGTAGVEGTFAPAVTGEGLEGVFNSTYISKDGVQVKDGEETEVVNMGEFAEGLYGIRATHSDGSYTQLTADGLERVITGESNKPYQYETYIEEATTKGIGEDFIYNSWDEPTRLAAIAVWEETGITVTLPTRFQGKDFKCFLSLTSMDAVTGADSGVTTYLKIIDEDTDYENATIHVVGYSKGYYSGSGWRYIGMDFLVITVL